MSTTQVPSAGDPHRPDGLPARYTVVELLAESGMSRVFLATDAELDGAPVVVKVPLAEVATSPEYRARFAREARIARKLHHHNIIGIIDSSRPGAEPAYLVMPYVQGPSLETLLAGLGRLDVGRALHIVRQVAAALDFAHANGVVHRDVKPGNIMLSGAEEHVYLCDFGIARERDGARLTRPGLAPGTPGIMAPELIRAEQAPADAGWFDPRADVYSLGAVLHHCLTGSPAYVGTGLGSLLWDQLNTDPPPVSEAWPAAPAAVDLVVRRAMSRDPGDRPATCAALVGELERAVAPPASGPGRVRSALRGGIGRFRPRRRTVAVLAGLGVAAAVAATALVMVTGDRVGATPDADQLARVPAGLRTGCRLADPGTGFRGAATVLACPASGRTVVVSLFDDGAGVRAAYADAVHRSGVARASGDCATAIGAEHRYPAAGTPTGRVLCAAADGGTTMVWTDDAARAIGRATQPGTGDLEAAWERWVGLPAFPTAAERSLVDLVALSGCRRPPASSLDTLPDVVAAVQCDPPGTGAANVTYYRFAHREALTRAQSAAAAAVGAPSGVDCSDGTAPGFLGAHRLDLRSVEVGDLLCYRDRHDTPALEWTLEPLLVRGRATGTAPKTLAAWWRGYFGRGAPTPALAAAADAQATPAFPTAAEQALLNHIPPASRVDCLRPPREQVEANVGRVSVTAVVCGPTRGAETVFYYQFDDAASMEAAYERNNDISGPDCTTHPADFHGDAPYHRGGASGRLGCARHAGTFSLSWSDTRREILVLAYGGGSELTLLDWWHFDAGPV